MTDTIATISAGNTAMHNHDDSWRYDDRRNCNNRHNCTSTTVTEKRQKQQW